MADNIAVTPGSGATIAADEVGSALYQRVKIAHGADGSATDASSAAPFPVSNQTAVETYTHAAGTAATSGDQTLVAAPGASTRIVVKDLVVQNESSTDTTILLKSGSTTQWRALLQQADGLVLSFATREEWRLGLNQALVLNLSGANSHGYSVRYFTESV